jgi:NADPH:quinone reductase-like Zn-dependent oxidoreductase
MSQFQIPDQMTTVVLDSYDGSPALRLERRPIPTLGKDQVLVKVAAAAINPSDLSFIEGNYGFLKPLPTVPGFEASGTVLVANNGAMGRYLTGKRVACVSQNEGDGVWADYVVTSVNFALPLDKSVSFEQGAMSVVNPLTAIALIELAKEGGYKALINTAAASALGQMILRLGQREGLMVINTVRRSEQVHMLKGIGADIVLNSAAPDFDQELKEACHQVDAHLALDAIAGRMTLRLLDAMPDNSKVTVYGGLSREAAMSSPAHLIFQDKRVEGFWLTKWLVRKNKLQSLLIWRRAQKLLSTDLKTEIRAQVPLENVPDAVKEYERQMTGGKILIIPDGK